jgi:hypothetical protein
MSGIFNQRRITLDSISGVATHTGSKFLVEYSLDCINYRRVTTSMVVNEPIGFELTGSINWSEIDLPNTGSSALVLIPTGSTCIRLTDLTFTGSKYVEFI